LISKIKLCLLRLKKITGMSIEQRKHIQCFKDKFSSITQIFVSESFSPNRSTQKYNLSECNTTKRLSSQCKTFLNVMNSHHEIDRKYILIFMAQNNFFGPNFVWLCRMVSEFYVIFFKGESYTFTVHWGGDIGKWLSINCTNIFQLR